MKLTLLDPLAPELRRSWLSLLPSFDPDDDGGGSDDDSDDGDDDDSDDGDDDDSDDGDDGDGDKGKNKDGDPAKRIKTLERSLRRARGESRRWKNLANANAGNGKKDDDDGGDGPDFRAAALTQAGVNALTAAGFIGTSRRAERLLATVGLDDIEPDRRGRFDPDDFEDVIEELREDFPELFRSEDDDDAAGRRRQPARNVSRQGGSGSSGGGRKLTSDEQFALAIAGQAGYSSVERKIRRGR